MQELQNSIFPITHTQNRLIVVDWDRLKVTKVAGKLQVLAIVSYSTTVVVSTTLQCTEK